MARPPSLNAHLYFECVARRGSLARAAEELSVTPSAVSQQIRLLEETLGAKLFRRKGRQLSLTLEGEQLFQASATALRLLRDAQLALGQKHDTRRLNLRVAPSYGVGWLAPRLSGFISRYPDWDIRVDAAPDPTDFDREVMDLDIRYGTGNWQVSHAEPVLDDVVLPLASPHYVAALTPGSPLEMLEQCRLIHSARALCQWDFWLIRNGLSHSTDRKSILIDRSSMALQLAKDGAGVVLESLALAADEVANGHLVPLVPSLPAFRFPAYWALCPSRHLNRRAVQGFLGWLSEQAIQHDGHVADIAAQHGVTIDRIDPMQELLHREK